MSETNQEEVATSRASEEKVPVAGVAEVPSELEALKKDLEEEKSKSANFLAGWQRAQADFINYRRRAEQERNDLIKFANATLVMKLLSVLDDFERAFVTVPRELVGLTWIEGIALIERKMRAILEQEGLAPIEAMGTDFDPQLHEAIIHEEGSDENDGKVVAELQRGYKFQDRVIRPTLAKVGKKRENAADQGKQGAEQ
ncbi:MAG: nucleotide exchange factor GrpE [Chloroflexi bacterium]|nr:nucleotide exchange factor GrpE [Chloroflexota bacterium]